MPSHSTATTQPEDLALASRIAPVLGAEEATDNRAGVDPSHTAPAVEPVVFTTQWTYVKWGVWAAIVLLSGFFARATLRPSSDQMPSIRQ